jgi:hypothetical protein
MSGESSTGHAVMSLEPDGGNWPIVDQLRTR